MWEPGSVDDNDPLRQGDLLDGVVLPTMKGPLEAAASVVSIGGAEYSIIPVKRKMGLVVSQCCDNMNGDYVAIAEVRPLAGLKPEQEEALLRYEPIADGLSGYDLEHFALKPLEGVLPAPSRGHHVAFLNRMCTMWGGQCGDFRRFRRARMTPAARRHLRLNLSLLWARVEAEDAIALKALDVPEGFDLGTTSEP